MTERKIIAGFWIFTVALFLLIALRVAYLASIGYYNYLIS